MSNRPPVVDIDSLRRQEEAAAALSGEALAAQLISERTRFGSAMLPFLANLSREEQLTVTPLLAEAIKDDRFHGLDPEAVFNRVKFESSAGLKDKELLSAVESIYRDLTDPPEPAPKPHVSHVSYGGGYSSPAATATKEKSFLSSLSELETAHAVGAGVSFLMAGLSAFGAWASFSKAVQRDENGQTHVQAQPLAAGVIQAVLAASIAYLGYASVRGAMAR